MQKISVLGAGTMGHGIAQLYAQAGFSVSLFDRNQEILERAITRITGNLDLLLSENTITEEDKTEALNRISTSIHLAEAVLDSFFIIEAVSENLAVKYELFQKLEELISDNAIIASNTSTFSIQQLSEGLQKKDRLLITHFFNPAHLVPLVEVVKGPTTPQNIVDDTVETLKKVGKQPVVLKKDIPGLIANRLQAALVREAFHLLDEGVADAKDIDLAITAGPGFRWAFIGPLETADLGGLDIWKSVVENLAPVLSPDTRIPMVINEKIELGQLGTKTGSGIFEYSSHEEVQDRILTRDKNFIHLLKMKNQ